MQYLYIDDESNSQEKANGFCTDELIIKVERPRPTWEDQLGNLSSGEFDGLILDLRLDDIPDENEDRAQFRGTALAQEIRTRQKEGLMRCFPIILFSANDKLQGSLDSIGQDLFDLCIDKTNVQPKDFAIFSLKLLDLVAGYQMFNQTTDINQVLNIAQEHIDARVREIFINIQKNESIPALIQFILNHLLERQGVLIDERMLAARLGVDIALSDNWDALLQQLKFAQYEGVFCNGWKRWWMSKIEYWWYEKISHTDYLRSTTASKRVMLLQEKLNIKLVPAEKIQKSNSDKFWTLCRGHNRPLDPNDGLLIINQDNLYPWQDRGYVSIDAALNRTNKEANWKELAEIEYEHFKQLEAMYQRPML